MSKKDKLREILAANGLRASFRDRGGKIYVTARYKHNVTDNLTHNELSNLIRQIYPNGFCTCFGYTGGTYRLNPPKSYLIGDL